MLDRVKVAAIQFDVLAGKKEENIAIATRFLHRAKQDGARLAVLPEYFNTTMPASKKELEQYAEPIPGPTTEMIGEVAKKNNMYITAGTIVEETKTGDFYNTATLIGPDGKVIGKYRKTHPLNRAPKDELGVGILRGEDFHVWDTKLGKIGILVDCDIDFPEPMRMLYLKGAEIVCWPFSWLERWLQLIPQIAVVRALENLCYLVGAGKCGTWKGSPYKGKDLITGEMPFPYPYSGNSVIAGPLADILACAGIIEEDCIVATLDLVRMRGYRKVLDFAGRRNVKAFKGLL